MYKASIDIGSNSTLLLVAKIENNIITEVCESLSTVTALGRDLDKTGVFHIESMDETKKALQSYCTVCMKYNIKPKEIMVTATEASRVAKNAKDFFKAITSELHLHFNIINGEAEAFYSTKGVLLDIDHSESDILIMDIGGASTELIGVKPQNAMIYKSFSMPCGSVRLMNWIEAGLDEKLKDSVNPFLNDIIALRRERIYCVAGTMTSVGNMILKKTDFKEDDVHGLTIKTSDIKDLNSEIFALSETELLIKFPFLGKRVKTIKSGIRLALYILSLLEVSEVIISTYGLRYGTLGESSIPEKFLA